MSKEQLYFHDLHSLCFETVGVVKSLMSGLTNNWQDVAHVKMFVMTEGRNDFVTGDFSKLDISTNRFFKITSEMLPYRAIVDHSCFIEIRDYDDRTESEGRKICFVPKLYKYTLIQASKVKDQFRLTAISLRELTKIISSKKIYGYNKASMSKRFQQL